MKTYTIVVNDTLVVKIRETEDGFSEDFGLDYSAKTAQEAVAEFVRRETEAWMGLGLMADDPESGDHLQITVTVTES